MLVCIGCMILSFYCIQYLNMRTQKQKKICKARNMRKFPPMAPQYADISDDEDCEKEEHQESMVGSSEPEEELELPPLKFMDVPISEVASLPVEERIKLKEQFPNLATYIFMSQREKTKYFHQKNLSFRKQIQTPGNLPARKIQFKRNFEVLVFDAEEPSQTIKEKKTLKCKYDPKIHYNGT